MSYIVTFYTKAVQPTQEYCATKKQAIEIASEEVKTMKKCYKKSGYKQVGSVRSGRVTFEHPCFGVDYMIKIEKN